MSTHTKSSKSACCGARPAHQGAKPAHHKPQPAARKTLEVPDKKTRTAIFQKMDYNGNGVLSLAEIDNAVIDMYPGFDHKPVLLRAYKAADVTGDGFIERKEFRKLMVYLVFFNNLCPSPPGALARWP